MNNKYNIILYNFIYIIYLCIFLNSTTLTLYNTYLLLHIMKIWKYIISFIVYYIKFFKRFCVLKYSRTLKFPVFFIIIIRKISKNITEF